MFKFNSKNHFLLVYILLFFSLLFGSLKPLLIQHGLLSQDISPLLMLSLTAITTALCALCTIKRDKIDRKHYKALLIAGTMLFLNSFALIYALERLSVISVSIIIALTPLLVGLHVSFIKKDMLRKPFYIGFLLAFAGVLLVLNIFNNNDFTFNVIGICLSFLAILASDFYRITLEGLTSSISSHLVSQYVLIIGGALGSITLFFSGISVVSISVNTFLLLFVIGFIAFMANLFFVKAIKISSSTKVSMIFISKPAVIAVLAFLLFNVKLLPIQIYGIILIMLGLFIYELDKVNAPKLLSNKL